MLSCGKGTHSKPRSGTAGTRNGLRSDQGKPVSRVDDIVPDLCCAACRGNPGRAGCRGTRRDWRRHCSDLVPEEKSRPASTCVIFVSLIIALSKGASIVHLWSTHFLHSAPSFLIAGLLSLGVIGLAGNLVLLGVALVAVTMIAYYCSISRVAA